MKTLQMKTVDGEIVTQFFPENDEDQATLDKMRKDGNLSQVDGFQDDTPGLDET